MKNLLFIITVIITFSSNIFGQSKELPYSNQWTVVTGISQPLLLNGVNLVVNYTTNRFVFEYSHGMFLEYNETVMKAEYRGKVDRIYSPYSTGTGVGYRFFAKPIIAMDLRAEAKVHQYNVDLNTTESIQYTNFDMGAGWYTQIRPFGKKDNALKGIVIEPSIRYWAVVSSTLEDDFQYYTNEDILETHQAYELGGFVNISIGYTFGN